MPWRTELLIIEVTDGARDVASVLFVLPQPLQYIQMALEEGYLYKHSTFLRQELECAELPHKGDI